MTVALVIAVCGLALFGLVLGLRFLDARAWRQSLVALRLHPPAGLSADNVAAWLGSLSALTHASPWWLTPHPPVVIEISATAQGIAHYLLVPESMRGALQRAWRGFMPGFGSCRIRQALRSKGLGRAYALVIVNWCVIRL